MARTKQTARKRTAVKNPERKDLIDKFNNKKCLDISPVIKQLQEDQWSWVTSLNFSGVEQITDTFLLVLKLNEQKMAMNSLQSLDLSGCCHITDEGIRWLSETENLEMENILLKGCKQLTHRSIYRLAENGKGQEEINMTATSCAFFPGQLPVMDYVLSVIMKGCPLVSPLYNLYNQCDGYNEYEEMYKDKDFVAYPHHKLLVLHDQDCDNSTGIFLEEPLDGDLIVQKGWRAETDASDFFNVFEVVTGNGTENLVLSNGCVIVLPFTTSETKTAIGLASNIITVLAQYPENVFVLAGLTADISLKKMREKVISILKGWMKFLSGSAIYNRGTDMRALTECTYADQMQIGFSQTLINNLNTLLSNPNLLTTVNMDESPKMSSFGSFGGFTKDPKNTKHSLLVSALKTLEKQFPWHMSTFMQEPVKNLDMMTKSFCSNLPLFCPLSEVNEDVKSTSSTFNRYDGTKAAVQILHDRGSCVFFPHVAKKPTISDITALPTVANLTGKAPHRAYIQGLGPDVPCWRKEDLSSLNESIKKHDNLYISVLKKQGLLFQFACSLEDPEFADTVLYVLNQDLPDSPQLPLDKVWPTDLLEGEEQRDLYMTFPALPSWVLPCFLRKLQEMSRVLLMWRTGLVVLQGPVMILVKQISNMACAVSDLPALVISARVMQSNMRNTLDLTFNNIITMLDAMLQKRKIFAVKSVCCASCNPSRSTELALSTNCCQVREMDIRLSEKPLTCSKTGSGIAITKETLSPPGLSWADHIPNHRYMMLMTQGFSKKLIVSPRCFLCNNCCLRGIHCPENLKQATTSRFCNCMMKKSLCVYCGVCDHCLIQFTKAHAIVQPSFHHPDMDTGSTLRAGSLVTFSAKQGYNIPMPLGLRYNRHITIILNSGNEFVINVQRATPPVFGLSYTTSTGEMTLDREKYTDTSEEERSCERYDQIDLIIVSSDTDQSRQELQVKKNGNVIFRKEVKDLSRNTVQITSRENGSIFLYMPNLMWMEQIDQKKNLSGSVTKCCGPFPTVLERRISVMVPFLESSLLKNSSGDLLFTGAAGVMLPNGLTWEDVICPTPRLLRLPELYHPICLANVNKRLLMVEELKSNWRHQLNLMHLVNAKGHTMTVSDEAIEQLVWGWQCLLTQYPSLELPPVYDQLFPQLASSAGKSNHRDELIGQGVKEIMRLYTIHKLSSYGESFDKKNHSRYYWHCKYKGRPISTSLEPHCRGGAHFNNKPKAEDNSKWTRVYKYCVSTAAVQHLQSIVSDNPERYGLTFFNKKRLSIMCPSHAACRSPGTSGKLTEIPKQVFGCNPKLMTCLRLQGNRLTSIPLDTFNCLPHLLTLNLSNNYIDALPDSIGQCKELLFISLETNNLVDLPASLANCSQVNQLHISCNRMQTLPPVIVKMKGLTHVVACNMMLTSLPDDIGDMSNLSTLLLKGNCLTSLPKSFANLHNLTTLAVTGVKWVQNQAKHFLSKSHFLKFLEERSINRWMDSQPEKLSQDKLFSLFDLDGGGGLTTPSIARFNAMVFKVFPRFGYTGQDPADDNNVACVVDDKSPSGFPEEILALENLKVLDLSYQGIVHVPAGIGNLKHLSTVTLSHNPHLLSIAAEASLCPITNNVINVSFPPQKAQSSDAWPVCTWDRVLILGHLVKTLMSTDQKSTLTGEDDITDGIDICTWDVDHQGDKISYSVWDFAGQLVYYNTHQFFLSDRAVYLLLWNIRTGHEQAGLKFWLNSIKVHAPKAPIFVVGTHNDQMSKIDLPVDDMRQKYQQIVDFHFVSSKTGDGIPKLQEALFKATIQQEYMGEKIPHAWLQLESLISKVGTDGKVNVMEYPSVAKVASEAGMVDSTEISQAVQFLHDLGSVQYFPTEHLKDHVVINPQWIVDVMACVVSAKQERIQGGHLMHSDLDSVWSDDHTMNSWLLRLTEEFDLTFPLEGESCNIVPCLLPEKQPDFEWPDIIKDEGIYEMKLIYKFDYLPSGLFNRAQVRLHGFSEDSMIWKRGSFIEKNGQLALIQHDGESELSVKVQGPNPGNMLLFIHEVFESLINESFQGVSYDYEIPCPDCTKHYLKDPYMFKATGIRRALELKAPFLQCQKHFHMAPILSLQAILAPDTNSDYEVHLDQDVNNLLQMQKEMATDIFISYCSRDAPLDRSEVIHPADIYVDLEKQGFTCYFPEGGARFSFAEMAQQLVHCSVFLVLISNNYADDEVCCDLYKYAVGTMKRPAVCVALGENFDWRKSPSLGADMSDTVFVNMINAKKPMYETKLKELLTTLQKHKQISPVKPENFNSCFVSYSWANSRLAVENGTKELPGALGFGDPRHIKEYLEGKGIKCWLDIDQVSVNDQLSNRIAEGLCEVRVMVACVSDQYALSKMCCKEMRFAMQLELPIVVVVVGTGSQWKRSEVGFNSMSFPTVDFQRPNPNACEDLLTLVKSEMLPERVEVVDRRKHQAHSDRANISFKEMYELTQRKFLRQISNYALTHDMANYPRLFVVDIDNAKSPEVKETKQIKDEETVRKYYIHTLCECEQGWHSVCIPLEQDFTSEELEEYSAYLFQITLVMKHSLDFVLNLFSDVDGPEYLKNIQEMAMKGSSNFETSYQQLRQKVFQMDSNSEKGKLKRCRLPSGKTVWLCEEHIAKLKVTVLSENVTEVQQKSTNHVWVEAMMEALRKPQTLPFKFHPTALQSRTFNSTTEDVAEVERHTKMTLSRTPSALDKVAIMQALQEEQNSDSPKKKREKKPKKERRKKHQREDQEKNLKEDGEKSQIEDREKSQIEDGDKSQIEDGEPQVEDSEKPQKRRRKSHKRSKNEETPTEGEVDSVNNTENVDSVSRTENGDSVNRTENGDSVNRTENGDSVNRTENGDSVNRTENGDSVNRTENRDSLNRTENGDSVNRTENRDSLNRTENGDSVKRTENGDSLNRTENGDSLNRTENVDSVNRSENGNASYHDSTVVSTSPVNPVPNSPTLTLPDSQRSRHTKAITVVSLQQDQQVSKTCIIL